MDEMTELPFAKPKRLISDKALKEYRRLRPHCEVLDCGQRSCPIPHHLKSRKMGRDDSPENLLSLCKRAHTEWHTWGGLEWFRRYESRLTPEARAKVMRALRID